MFITNADLTHTMLLAQFTVLKVVGIWYPPNWLSKRLSIVYRFYSVIILILLCTLALSQTARIVFYSHKFQDFNDTFFILLSTNLTCFKAICIIFTQNRVLKLISMFERDCCLPQSDFEKNILKKTEDYSRLIEFILLAVVETTASTMIISSIFGNINKGELLYKVYLPYDISKPLPFWLTFVHHSLGAVLFTSISITIDGVIAGFMIHLCGQLQILQHRMKILLVHVIEASKHESKDAARKYEKQLLGFNVKHHNHILSIAESINSTFSEIVTGQFIVSSLSICVSVYQISSEKEHKGVLLFYVLYLWCMLVQFYLYCYFGNEVTLQSESLRTAMFHINWSMLSLEGKKELLFIIQRSAKPIEMFKGIFICLTLETFTNIVKKSYSVFTVLKNSL